VTVIQFGEVAELLAELETGAEVRIETLEMPMGKPDGYGIRLMSYGVHVRARHDEAVLACFVPVKYLELMGEQTIDGKGGTRAEAWATTKALHSRLRAWAEYQGFHVRPGVIDIGEVTLIRGHWSEGDGDERTG
jgi:hypothetical protein